MALFNWAFAKSNGGDFLLRIEDTDQARSSAESEQAIYSSLRWLGLDWDEGPDVGGACGPYRQSERKSIYADHVQQLIQQKHAFYCFCTKERLDNLRAEQQAAKQTTRYDGHCLNLSAEEVAERLAAGEEHVVRMRVPDEGECKFEDRLRGEISIPYAQVDMQVLVKADGMPTYHLAVVVDDHLMGITHILRGEEWINSVPKHKLLFEYFGWEVPELVHLPLLRNPDSSKLSKRKNPTSVNYYRDKGYLPEALLNYLALMGWSMPDEREQFSLAEMADAFDVDRISVRGPIFDVQKLDWLNGEYLRGLDADAFAQRAADFFNSERLKQVIPLVNQRVTKLSELVPMAAYLFGDIEPLSESSFEHKQLERADVVKILYLMSKALDVQRDWQREALLTLAQRMAEHLGYKFRDFLFPLFIALSGRAVALPLFDAMLVLGPDLTRARVRDALTVLGVSGKEKKRLDKEPPLPESDD